jgi:hypothetical protein
MIPPRSTRDIIVWEALDRRGRHSQHGTIATSR